MEWVLLTSSTCSTGPGAWCWRQVALELPHRVTGGRFAALLQGSDAPAVIQILQFVNFSGHLSFQAQVQFNNTTERGLWSLLSGS